MSSQAPCRAASLLALVFTISGISIAQGQYLRSPCPDIFTYQVDPNTKQIFGYVEIDNIQVGQTVKLNIDLSIAAPVPQNNVGSIALAKSKDEIFNDIVHGNPAQYRVNFPLQNILPSVLSIAVNGQTICTGSLVQGHQTTINLEHTLYTRVEPNGFPGNNGYQPNNGFLSNNQFQYQRPVYTVPPRPTRPQFSYTEPVTQRVTAPAVFMQPITSRPVPMRTTVAPPTNYACGKPSANGFNQLAFNGKRVNKGQFPWIAPLFDQSDAQTPSYFCGSTIISNRHLITAAHCIYDAGDFMSADRILAVPGMYNIDNFADDNANFAFIDSVHPHNDYINDDDLNDADIAILRLKKVLIYTEYIIPICLWNDANDLDRVVNQEGIVAGWGVTETGPSTVPTFIKASIVSKRSCRDNVEKMLPINSRVFCADGHGSAPCNGDSGTGFVLKRGNQYYLRGIVSKGQQDPETLLCDVRKFAIYTDVALFRYWIKTIMS
ncbi:serine protease gd-like [Aedes albopictus]|uniref:Putative serine protease n=1 Tax=Aedes albopictus TaxID=7160 RepID=A0A023EVW5_AEDAL